MRAAFALSLIALVVAPGTSHGDVTPGDVVTFTNRDKLAGLLPEELVPFIVEGFEALRMEIGETGSFRPHPKYAEATVKYACQASLDERGNLVDYTAGQPFPYSKWAQEATDHACDLALDDPQLGLKLAWNVNYRWQGGSGLNLPHWGFSNMRNHGRETWRIAQGEYRRTYFSHRADLLPETHELEKGTELEWAEFFDVKTPFDLRGTMFLLYRYTTDKEDDTWAYIPALRRVRRIAATQKSDSLLGTEFTLEDFYGFSGYVWDHDWEFQGERTGLAVVNSPRTCFPSVIGEEAVQRTSGMSRLGTEEEWTGCSFGPYNAFPMIDDRWQKRTLFELHDVPRQKGHPYSRKKLWYDRETLVAVYGIANDRAGNPYRIILSRLRWSEDSANPGNRGRHTLNYIGFGLANVQNGISHVAQFDTANAYPFPIEDSLKYYDITKLRKKGR